VALILDVVGLAQNANIFSEAREHAMEEKTAAAFGSQGEKQVDKQSFLLFVGPDDSRMALPLSSVARLEEFPASNIEKSGSEWVIQYRGKILPLIRLDVVLEERRTRLRHPKQSVAPDPIQVLVCNDEGRMIGIVVERILDIVEDRAEMKSRATREGIQCAVVIDDRVTELIDIPALRRIVEANRILSAEQTEVIN
jgi:two-component system chemotaxis sensor kinase CheA